MKSKCNICLSDNVTQILNLPNYPLNSQYNQSPILSGDKYFRKFELLSCIDCGHIFGESGFQLDELYHDDYSYRPSSPNIQWRVNFLLSQLKSVSHIDFNRVIDIGCFNGQLLKKAKEFLKSDYFIGVDPSMSIEMVNDNKEIIFIKDFIQNVNLPFFSSFKPDLIISDQCFEHIDDLNLIVSNLNDQVSDNSKFFICVPSLEAMSDKLNFQFIIHEHLNYFTVSSLFRIFKKYSINMERYYIDYESASNFNLAVFTKNNECNIEESQLPIVSINTLIDRINLFKQNIDINNDFIQKIGYNNKLFGFGASDLTSNLAYFMKSNLNFLETIIDDTIWKNDLYIPGVEAQIVNFDKCQKNELKNSFCLITAPQATRYIIARLNELGVKGIIIPTNSIL